MDAPLDPTAAAPDPTGEVARQAADAIGLPPWVGALLSLLVPVLIVVWREWRKDRRALSSVIMAVDDQAEAMLPNEAESFRKSIQGQATSDGIEGHLKKAVLGTRKFRKQSRNGGAPTQAQPGPGPGA